jgi:hypothetical protein
MLFSGKLCYTVWFYLRYCTEVNKKLKIKITPLVNLNFFYYTIEKITKCGQLACRLISSYTAIVSVVIYVRSKNMISGTAVLRRHTAGLLRAHLGNLDPLPRSMNVHRDKTSNCPKPPHETRSDYTSRDSQARRTETNYKRAMRSVL